MPQSRIWLVSTPSPEVDALKTSIRPRIEVAHKEGMPKDLRNCLLLWVHVAPGQDEPQMGEGEVAGLRAFVEQGGRLLLTGAVAALVGPLGAESQPPVPMVRVWEAPLRGEERLGVACFLEHPLFSRFPGGVFLRKPFPGCRIGGAMYEAGGGPQEGRLIGVERSGRGIDRDRGLLVEHRLGKGWILSLGAHLVFHDEAPGRQPFAEERLRFLGDMVDYLCAAGSEWQGFAWPPLSEKVPDKVKEARQGLRPIALVEPAPVGQGIFGSEDERSPGTVAHPCPQVEAQDFCLDTTEGAALLGDVERGVCEVWGLPVCFFKDFAFEGEGFETEAKLEAWPFGVRRTWGDKPKGPWIECWGKAGARSFVGRLEHLGDGERPFELTFKGIPQLSAPYPKRALGAAQLSYDAEGRSFELTDQAAGYCARLDFSEGFEAVKVEQGEAEDFGGYTLRLMGKLGSGKALEWRLSLGASVERARDMQREVAARSAQELVQVASQELEEWLSKRLSLSPNGPRGPGHKWLRAKARDLFVTVPPGPQGPKRAGFLAGQGQQRGQKGDTLSLCSSGGQFRGSQGLWMARSLLPCGCFEEARAHLELLAEYQGPSGEIFEGLSPAGTLDYDSSDSTALFIEVMGRYLAWTGDLDFAERLWPSLRRAIAFLGESDQDGDGICESRGGLSGWPGGGTREVGLREGTVARVHQVALQAAAFAAAASLAESLGVPGGGDQWRRQERLLREHLARRFYDDSRGFYALGLKGDGSFDRRESALALFPLLFGQADRSQAAKILARLEQADFVTPQGLRPMFPLEAPLDPDSGPDAITLGKSDLQLGFCLALAETLYGKGEQGADRWVKLIEILCAMDPLAEGQELALALSWGGEAEALLGAHVRPDGASLGLRVALPPQQDHLSFQGLRFRGLSLSGQITRSTSGENLSFSLDVKGEGEELASLGLFIPKTFEVKGGLEGEVELQATMEQGLDGCFFVAPERSLHPGDRIEWELSLSRKPEESFELVSDPLPEPICEPSSQAAIEAPNEAPQELETQETKKPLRIAHICHGYPPEFHGGTEHYVQGLALAQKEQGHAPLVITGRGEAGSGILREDCEGIPVFRLGKDLLFHERWYHGFSPQILGELLSVLQEEEIDFVHIHHWMRLSFDLGAWVRAFGIPTVVTLHDLSTTCPRALRIQEGNKFCETEAREEICVPCAPREDWMRDEDLGFLLEWFTSAQERELRVSGAILAPSESQRRFLCERIHQDLEIRVLPHGSLPSMKPLQEAQRPGPRGSNAPLRLAYWGHIQPLKGVHLLLEAVGRLPEPKRVKIILWGDADDPFYASQIEELGQGLDLEWKKSFHTKDLVDLQADLAVFPSLAHETWSFVLDEAFAKGLPVLCSDRGALPERVDRGGTAFPAGDSAALAAKIERILEEPELLETYRRHLPALQPMEDHAETLEGIYRDLLSEGISPEELSEMRKETLDLLEDLKRWEETTRRHEERCRELAGLREKAEAERGHLEDNLKETFASIEEHKERLASAETQVRNLLDLKKEQSADLENHKTLVKDLKLDLDQHKKELQRAREDFKKTEAYLIENKKILEERDAQLLLSHKEVEKVKIEVEEGKVRIQAFQRDLEELREELAVCQDHLNASSRREKKLLRENRFAFLLTIPAKLLFGLWDRIRGKK